MIKLNCSVNPNDVLQVLQAAYPDLKPLRRSGCPFDYVYPYITIEGWHLEYDRYRFLLFNIKELSSAYADMNTLLWEIGKAMPVELPVSIVYDKNVEKACLASVQATFKRQGGVSSPLEDNTADCFCWKYSTVEGVGFGEDLSIHNFVTASIESQALRKTCFEGIYNHRSLYTIRDSWEETGEFPSEGMHDYKIEIRQGDIEQFISCIVDYVANTRIRNIAPPQQSTNVNLIYEEAGYTSDYEVREANAKKFYPLFGKRLKKEGYTIIGVSGAKELIDFKLNSFTSQDGLLCDVYIELSLSQSIFIPENAVEQEIENLVSELHGLRLGLARPFIRNCNYNIERKAGLGGTFASDIEMSQGDTMVFVPPFYVGIDTFDSSTQLLLNKLKKSYFCFIKTEAQALSVDCPVYVDLYIVIDNDSLFNLIDKAISSCDLTEDTCNKFLQSLTDRDIEARQQDLPDLADNIKEVGNALHEVVKAIYRTVPSNYTIP